MATLRIAAKPGAATMQVAQISKPGGVFEIVEREVPEPNGGHVRIRVQACGICHSDVLTKEGLWPGIQYPRIPGHEVAGIIDQVGNGVSAWKNGQRVVWAGTAAMTGRVANAGAEILTIAATCKFQVSATTAASRNTCSCRQRRSWLYRTL
jgi:D-arabinose 1-dehydrogenase-like Zn-dependent alcohol dehydrogenase